MLPFIKAVSKVDQGFKIYGTLLYLIIFLEGKLFDKLKWLLKLNNSLWPCNKTQSSMGSIERMLLLSTCTCLRVSLWF